MRELTEAEIAMLRDPLANYALHIDVYHEDMGNVLWWVKPGHVMPDGWGVSCGEPPWAGKPGDSDWAGYHEWFTFLPPYPTEWMAPPPKPPEFTAEIEDGMIVIRHLPSGQVDWLSGQISVSGWTLKQYEDHTRYKMRRMREIAGMRSRGVVP